MKNAKTPPDALNRAIAAIGGVGKTARAMGVAKCTVSAWKARGAVPGGRCERLSELSGVVTAADLRPDLFGGGNE